MSNRIIGKSISSILAIVALVLAMSMSASAAPTAPSNPDKGQAAAPSGTQYFQDVAVGSFFYPFTSALYNQGVVSGYTCGTPPAGACVPPNNLPYYIPSGNVTRGQMSIYIQNARTKPGINITNSSSLSYTPISGANVNASGIGIYGGTSGDGSSDTYGGSTQAVVGYATGNQYSVGVWGASSNGIGVRGEGTSRPGVWGTSDSGYGLRGGSNSNYGGYFSSTSNDAADFSGALWGIYTVNSGTEPSVFGYSSGTGSYAGYFNSVNYRGLYAQSPTNWYSLYVEANGSTVGAYVDGNTYVNGNLTVTGSKSGYVVDVMKNASGETLEAGDVVVIASDSDAAVLGDIPVPAVKKASSANDSGVVGIVDVPMYVPDAATAAAYNAQKEADRQAAANAAAHPDQKLPTHANIENRISDDMGMPHADKNLTTVAAGAYANVVTLGAYKMVKVDASFGPIKAGDLLTTSPHAGYAMKVTDKAASSGAVIGKALSSLNKGTGTITVLVTLK